MARRGVWGTVGQLAAAVGMQLMCVGAHWWADESWGRLVYPCCLMLLVDAVGLGTWLARRAR